MRIGELAALVGVSARTVRHYHRLGLLPEPTRQANGYRIYGLRDAVELARIRRLAELGLSLDEIRNVLAGDEGRDLREVLAELDADLARQQAAISDRRRRLAELLAQADLEPDSTVSPDLAAVLRELPADGSRFAELDRAMLSLIDTGADPEARSELLALFQPLTAPEAVARARELYARMDELADADRADPRVEPLAVAMADQIPPDMAAVMATHAASEAEERGWLAALAQELSPAQVEVLRRMVVRTRERAGC